MIKKFVQKGFLYDTLNKIIDKVNNSENNVSKNYQSEIIIKDGQYYIKPLNYNFSDFKTLDDLPSLMNVIVNMGLPTNITMTKLYYNINGDLEQEGQYVYYIFNFQGSAFMNIVLLDWNGLCQIDTNMIDDEFYYPIKTDYNNDNIVEHLSINGNRSDDYDMIYDENNNERYNVERDTLYYAYKPNVTINVDNTRHTLKKENTFKNAGFGMIYDGTGKEINVDDYIGDHALDDIIVDFYTYNPTENNEV